jgi:hypothetical protein
MRQSSLLGYEKLLGSSKIQFAKKIHIFEIPTFYFLRSKSEKLRLDPKHRKECSHHREDIPAMSRTAIQSLHNA